MGDKTQVNGIHRAKMWQIGGFALNNTATNLYMFLMNFIAYYLTGYIGVGVVLASTLIMMMRIWDGVTDPFIGYVVDKTNTKFGKNRPFMVIGNIILAIGSFVLLHVSHLLPQSMRFIFFILIYMVYIIGYTFQCVVTKSAQTCITNDPKQRPLFSIFDGVYNTAVFALIPILVSTYLIPKYGGFNADFFHEAWMMTAGASAVCTCLAVFAISKKDRIEFFGLGKPVKIGFKDYWDVLRHNRAIQMLVVSASTDKLATSGQSNATVVAILYGVIVGNYAMSGAVSAYTTIPSMLLLFFGVGWVATRLGQRKAMLFGSLGGLICTGLQIVLFTFADPTTMSFPGFEGFTGWNFFTLAFLGLWILSRGFIGVSGGIVIPMTADCADYEVYRTGRYVPGLMGTLFSFVDKLISSLAPAIIGIMCAAIGFKDALPDMNTPYSPQLKFVGLFCMFGLLIVGLTVNLIAMKFYPLTKEKMESIQKEIAEIKAKSQAEAS